MTFLYVVKDGDGIQITSGYIIGFKYTSRENTWVVIDLELTPNALDDFNLSEGQLITIQYGVTGTENYLFRGTVEIINPTGSTVVLTCYDKLYQLTKRTANESYDVNDAYAGKISSIIIDLITRFGGLTADTSSIQDTGVLVLKEKLFCYDAIVFDKVIDLCKVFSYVLYYDSDTDKSHCSREGL